ncbi:GLPGLI family protein [Filimonas lacunae]|uniref:GLPGLI family protein n=1 Tax=Filimonas lacunae TaxID=477680 RepID=A0A1N7PU63_9BACT|nr:GLPGLI family protein [Filimonas lacunae]SIT14183.1 GLPGLI family protein [Filimonas lacunae]
MNAKQYMLLVILLCGTWHSQAQQPLYLTAGKIEFEKKVNMYAQMEGEDDEWVQVIKKNMSQFRVTYHNLLFNGDSILYTPGRSNPDNSSMEFAPLGEDNIVFTNLTASQCVSQKKVYDERYLVKDSTRQIAWKLTNETRMIAGFECRRANALIMDSVYVVAFYTDAIIPAGGPESFNGLPGMILGVALPHDHVSWFATKVYAEAVPVKLLQAPAKGKASTNKTMQEELQTTMKRWGKYGQKNILAAML